MILSEDLKSKILKIKLLLLDVDGVLSDGRIIYGNYGDELKFFDVQDGLGLVLLSRAGLKTVIVSSRKSRINQKRASELKVDKLYQRVDDKLKVFEKVMRKYHLAAEEICYIADDLIDIPVLKRAGFSVAVANAVEETKGYAHYVTAKTGGRGAVRELSDLILKTQDKWQEIMKPYLR